MESFTDMSTHSLRASHNTRGYSNRRNVSSARARQWETRRSGGYSYHHREWNGWLLRTDGRVLWWWKGCCAISGEGLVVEAMAAKSTKQRCIEDGEEARG